MLAQRKRPDRLERPYTLDVAGGRGSDVGLILQGDSAQPAQRVRSEGLEILDRRRLLCEGGATHDQAAEQQTNASERQRPVGGYLPASHGSEGRSEERRVGKGGGG